MLLIDGDILLYRVGFAAQKEVYSVYLKDEPAYLARLEGKTALNNWLKEVGLDQEDVTWEMEIVTDPIENAFHSIKLMIESMQKKLEDYDYKLFLTGDGNFRFNILPSYKAGRKARPLLYDRLRNYLIKYWNAIVVDGMEADDAIGIYQCTHDNTCICTIDKDLDMIPGEHYNFVTEEHYVIDEEQAWNCYYQQILTGDGVDNICGIKGVGPAKAKKLLSEGVEEVIDREYEKYWGEQWHDVLDCNKQLLWIRRK